MNRKTWIAIYSLTPILKSGHTDRIELVPFLAVAM